MKKTICFVTLGCAKNTVYSENDDFGLGHVFTPFRMEDWIEKDKKYIDYEKKLRGQK